MHVNAAIFLIKLIQALLPIVILLLKVLVKLPNAHFHVCVEGFRELFEISQALNYALWQSSLEVWWFAFEFQFEVRQTVRS